MLTKICNDCELPKNNFTKDNRNKDGLQGRCNDCRSIKRKGTHKYYPNPEYSRKNAKKHIDLLSDFIVIAELKRGTNLTTEDIKKHPVLIEAKRQVLLTKRKLKNEKHKRAER